ncbi:hypothetical protein EN836_17030 [Mesorhizobium sp. M1C.F.Ca.ET.193.01.1.1]|uniref:DUF2231 domain-containing protein n=1 Tax=unclassified Mesorhizobium TaxID=325217 RepID=UPI000FD5A334|nr:MULTISPECIES: DUF2231 domain-containing protein [unclassified Mesorhizobium]TGS99063.1 hypothetical protein EN820_35760 [bacterium M00.F.Ca.ET.177.01.1.1]RWA77299.1 MAG: hypothetical protein EOQ28_00755 [Mesorhizobium sp.]RWC01072.1 MAG: hypothetical protein EOQ57_14160 [Mesorhizobium sp.]RWG84931.1 MAG: hypothetical protein EOQ69_10320 [Mesorhizobium sp.]RWG90080.1 MAG: hypothetical protein EOQ70_05620 [Mesorhizobium sp.]
MPAIQHVHPILVHFPIVLIYTLAVIDLIALAKSNAVTMRSSVGTISTFVAVTAGLFAVGTWFFGGMALDHAEAAGFSSEVAEIHESLGTISAATFLGWGLIRLALWARNRELGTLALAIPAVEIAGAALVTVTAYYGGQLVYDLGVNVTKAAVGG